MTKMLPMIYTLTCSRLNFISFRLISMHFNCLFIAPCTKFVKHSMRFNSGRVFVIAVVYM